ncbi:MAG: sodium/solute symporter [Saprospiraceae bacterium]|nr:sodium/solute symporter [Saprospiraceae bacterium]
MSPIDWLVMLGVLGVIAIYGMIKTRSVKSVQSYLMGDKDLSWWTIGLSVMATQASAITFLSTPGQAYESGMGFAQFYFGMPVAMVLLCIFALPIYYRLNVYTAYEYLEGRFDLKTRLLTAFLFLLQRGMAAGITIYAPSIILSNIFGWDLNFTIFLMGIFVIAYTVFGGTKAVSVTQKQQMLVILIGLAIAGIILVYQLPRDVSFGDAVSLAGKMGKLEVVNFEFDLSNRYTFWTGMLGGVFLFLSYFGTDQSQVQRYLSGKSLSESRLGLLFNGIIKVPMQFMVLFIGVLVYVFFQFTQPPVHFNQANLLQLKGSSYEAQLTDLQAKHTEVYENKQVVVRNLITAIREDDEATIKRQQAQVQALLAEDSAIRDSVKNLILKQTPTAAVEDNDYVFITFVTNYLPVGLVGLLLAVIFSAAMSSTSSELNALATASLIDFYRRIFVKHRADQHYLNASKWLTALWGIIALLFAAFASLFDNLIEAVNIVGSVFYGTILGIFVVAFFLKQVRGNVVFWSAILAEILVIIIFVLDRRGTIEIAYLWLNLIGCLLVVMFSFIAQLFSNNMPQSIETTIDDGAI